MKKLLFGILACCCLVLPLNAQDGSPLRDEFPDVYVVRQGDTLWDIANTFLKDPWLWPEIWYVNEQIANPHLIYPGDRISLVYIDGKPRLTVDRGRDVKLGPTVKSTPIGQAIPAIPLEAINAFLSRSRIVGEEEFGSAPYTVAGDNGHVIVGAGDRLFARGEFPAGERQFGIYRRGKTFIDPFTGELLGLEALDIGRGKLVALDDDIGTLAVNASNEEVRVNDRLLPYVEQRINSTFYPSAPDQEVEGVIVAVEGGVSQVGRLDIVVINLGGRDGIADGNVLAIDKKGDVVRDPVTKEALQLPDQRAGLLMVFRTFDKMSYGLVLNATLPLKVMDYVRKP